MSKIWFGNNIFEKARFTINEPSKMLFLTFCLFPLHLFFNKKSIFDPRPENCLSFSKKLFSRWSINFYCLNIQTL